MSSQTFTRGQTAPTPSRFEAGRRSEGYSYSGGAVQGAQNVIVFPEGVSTAYTQEAYNKLK